jgi:FkbM family methyltransferase
VYHPQVLANCLAMKRDSRDARGFVKTVRLSDGTEIFCLARPEARALDAHIDGYFRHGIELRPDDVVFDVGANIGVLGVRIAQRNKGRAKVFAFEPLPPIRAVLEANAKRHGEDAIHVLPWALSQEPGTMEIAYYPRSPALSTGHPEIWDGTERLTDTVVGHAGSRRMPRFAARLIARFLRGSEQRHTCTVRTLPDVRRELGVERIDLLKVDVEGAELDVLLGIGDDASEWSRIRSAVIEVHDIDGRVDKVRALLERHGFDKITVDAEAGFERTVLRNVYAARM